MTRGVWTVVVGALLLALPARAIDPPAGPASGAGDLQSEAATGAGDASAWEFEVASYGWVTASVGSLAVKGVTAHVDLTVKDTLDLLTGGNAFAAAGYFSARYDRWSTFVDAFGGYAQLAGTATVPTPRCNLDIAARLKMKPVLVDFGLGYELGRWALPQRRRPATLGVYAGMRYTWIYQRVSASASVPSQGLRRSADVSASVDWADPMVGIRWEVPLLDAVSLDFRGDIGGFGASSDLIWGLTGGVRAWLPWTPMSVRPWIGLGYRVVAFDHPLGDDAKADLQFRGPTSGLGFVF